jgi:hypothetical protein
MQDPLETSVRRLERLAKILGVVDAVLFVSLIGLILLFFFGVVL